MALSALILQGTAACAAIIECALTTLLRDQVRRYGADLPTSLPPRNDQPIDQNVAAKRQQAGEI